MGKHRDKPQHDNGTLIPPQDGDYNDDDVPTGCLVGGIITIGLVVICALTILCAMWVGLI